MENDFDSFVERQRSHSKGENLPEGYVPQSVYWLIDGEYIGSVRIRHRLNDNLEKVGGHIGYNIRPSRRRQGYGKKLLALGLQEAKELGISRVLLTCDITNEPSRRVIESNGGVRESVIHNQETGIDKARYWVDVP